MRITQLVDEDFVNYKKPSLFLGFSRCSFKCDREADQPICQNKALSYSKIHDVSIESIIGRYISNPITSAIVMGGLEPLDDFLDVTKFISQLRTINDDDVVIYTGYNENEIPVLIHELQKFSNVYIKFGRYLPNQEKHYDSILGVNLASDNQYGKKIS